MFGFIKRFLGSSQERTIRKFRKIVDLINYYDEKFSSLSKEDLKSKTQEFKNRYQKGESLDEILPEAYAVVKSICRRLIGEEFKVSGYRQKWDMVPYDVQCIGAIAMHFGYISEMQTGEGKTLTAVMPLYLNSLKGESVHLITVNDYLACRDNQWVGTILRELGLTTGVLSSSMSLEEKKATYRCDVVYGTASEFGFDYLRDNSMATSSEEQVQNGYNFAVIDEIDSILIDEARTPLIISGAGKRKNPAYEELKDFVEVLVKEQREFCNKLANDARRVLENFWEKEVLLKDKKILEDLTKACHKLWNVSKGMPLNKTLRRAKEHPDLRMLIDKWDLYYYSEQNKDERYKVLSDLVIVLDEKSSDFELTDKGIKVWGDITKTSSSDFIMLDMGYEYALIDAEDIKEEEKIKRKIALTDEDTRRKSRVHALRQLLRAHLLMEKDVDYIVEDSSIVIIDENTGRPQPGRRFSDGLHQAIEAKEGVTIQRESHTYATITLQNYFRLYDKLSGMTGTAITESAEFKEIYNLRVLQIPTFKPCQRIDYNDEFYMTEREKYNAIIKEVMAIHSQKRPILIGTESVEVSEKLSRILQRHNITHTVLNAKNHAREAEIIAEAGKSGAVTVATNMAGRGTDIKLENEASVHGGLHLIGTTRNQSRRIDRQLRGRCARLGDPGSSKFFLSFEDNLMRLFSSPKMNALIQRFRPPEGEAITDRLINKMIETAQKRVEARNYAIRKHTLEYDDVMNKQRKEIYDFRNEILFSNNLITRAKDILYNTAEYIGSKPLQDDEMDSFREEVLSMFPITLDKKILKECKTSEKRVAFLVKEFTEVFSFKYGEFGKLINNVNPELNSNDICNQIIRSIMISHIDKLWQDHLCEMDLLKSEVSLCVVGQKDPLIEFKKESFNLFLKLIDELQLEISKFLFKVELDFKSDSIIPRRTVISSSTSFNSFTSQEELFLTADTEPIINLVDSSKSNVKRNDMCPCNSGKKYKKCCGRE